MPIVTISRGSYQWGKQVAESLADKTGYHCISREELIKESEKFNTFEIKLRRALHGTTSSVFDHLSYDKTEYLAYIQEKILEHMVQDNTIYHGLTGHAFVYGLSHLLNVRIQANYADRLREEMSRENIPREDASYSLKKGEEERRLWSMFVTGIDHMDPSYYDLIYNASKIPVGKIVAMMEDLLKEPYLQATEESQQQVENLYLAAKVKRALVKEYPDVKISASNGEIVAKISASKYRKANLDALIKEKALKVKDVKGVEVKFVQD